MFAEDMRTNFLDPVNLNVVGNVRFNDAQNVGHSSSGINPLSL